MSAAVTALRLLMQFHVEENPGSQPAGVNLTSQFDELNQLLLLNSSTTPAPSLFAVYKTTISGGGYTIDATTAQGTNGTINASGKKLLGIVINNPSASAGDINVATGATNGYALPQPIKVEPGGFAVQWFASALGAVGSSAKTIDITATNGDTPEIGLVFG